MNDLKSALTSAVRTIDFRYDRLDLNNNYVGEFPSISNAMVTHDALADLKRSILFTAIDEGGVDWINDRIKPWFRILLQDGVTWWEWPLGVFLLNSPAVVDGLPALRQVDGYDGLVILNDDKIRTRYVAPAGEVVTALIAELLTSAGIYQQNIVASPATLPAAMDWDPGITKLYIVNQLLGAINYEGIWFDGNGYAIVEPYQPPSDKGAVWEYFDDAESMIIPQVSNSLDLFEVPNQWILTVSESDRTLTSVYTNDNIESVTSTVNRGRTVVDFEMVDAVDQGTLDDLAYRKAVNASSVYEDVDFPTGLMPFHNHLDVVSIRYNRLSMEDLYEEIRWDMQLQVGWPMHHTLRKLVHL